MRALSAPADSSALLDAIGVIRSAYVDEVPWTRLAAGALRGALETLDPYSQYLSAEQYRELRLDTEGEFDGVGLELTLKDGALRVIAPLDGSPAAEAGLEPGDAITRVDGVSTRGLTLGQAVDRIRLRADGRVTLTVERDGADRPWDVTLERRRVRLESVTGVRVLDGAVGYVRLSTFQQNTPEDFARALRDLRARGIRSLIVDVRNNSGGLLPAAIDTAAVFVPEGLPVVFTRGRDGRFEERLPTGAVRRERGLPLAVLVNEGSASGAEILAAAVQDHRLGRVVGTRTFGKGSIQSLLPLPGGDALRLTTSRFYTPARRPIQDEGVTPDVVTAPAGDGAADGTLEAARELLARG